MPQPRAFGCAFYQARNVCDHKATRFRSAYDAEVRVQSRERVVGYLWSRVGYLTDQSGLAGVGKAQQTDVSEYFELELESALLALLTGGALTGRAVGAGLEAQIAQTTLAARGKRHSLAVMIEVEQLFASVGVGNGGANRHTQYDVFAGSAVLVRATAVFAIFGLMLSGIPEINQCIDIAVGDGVYASPAPAVATVRSAFGYEFFAPKAGSAIAAFSGDDFNGGFVYEFHG